MADLLTHLFLPLTVAYVLRRDLFRSPAYLLLAGFGLLSDFDKFLGQPGLLHSLVTLVPICVGVLVLEYGWRGELVLGPLVVALIASHLVLDLVDGSPVPLLYPFVREGIVLQYPSKTVFGTQPVGVAVQGPLVRVAMTTPRPGFNTYGFIRGEGVLHLLGFAGIYFGLRWREGPLDE